MKLYLCGHEDRYAVEQLQLALFPEESMEPVDAPFDGDGAVSALHTGRVWLTATARITLHGRTARALRRMKAEGAEVAARRRLLQNAYYDAAMQLREPPEWGSLSGVRPSKLTTRHLLAGGTVQSADRLMRDTYHVSPARRRLCIEASQATVDAAARLRPQDVSVYVGIPFCPTRCAYCSFVSSSIEKQAGLLEPYLDALEREIAHVGRLLRESGRTVRTLYMGGGTPTTLSAAQMERLMAAIERHFDLTELIEYTVEGGRPDTLDLEKLSVIRRMGCDRMSINPQTMNDDILCAIGRRHTGAQTVEAYRAAVEAGFEGINMDLIAGLPGDTRDSFADSLSQVLALAPSNVTVHTLALKKGADLFFARLGLPEEETVRAMLADTEAALRGAGYVPYYLYRQKYMSGSFENVGWCKPGFEGLYNIYMMEELHSIISVGGGGMTKINLPGGRLERFHNPKFPQQYLERIEDVLLQKNAAFALLGAETESEKKGL
ncbi:MAG: coproporphyrinogen dehydrogenase HemZ [Oscillospiraceae bacterium]|nr:coproporphyrinogen dehydrogenase HemZ [Oscillospiraceae bacterium]